MSLYSEVKKTREMDIFKLWSTFCSKVRAGVGAQRKRNYVTLCCSASKLRSNAFGPEYGRSPVKALAPAQERNMHKATCVRPQNYSTLAVSIFPRSWPNFSFYLPTLYWEAKFNPRFYGCSKRNALE